MSTTTVQTAEDSHQQSERQPPTSLVDWVGSVRPFAERNAQLLTSASAKAPVRFDAVCPPGQSLVAATIASAVAAKSPDKRVWVLARDLRTQENLFSELSSWWDKSVFFPELEINNYIDALPDPDVSAERLGVLHRLADEESEGGETLVLIHDSLDEDVQSAESLRSRELKIAIGDEVDLEHLPDKLSEAGYEKVAQVFERGQLAIRGGILDVFSWQGYQPIRIELFGEDVDSIRAFDVDTQASTEKLEACTILLSQNRGRKHEDKFCKLRDYIGADDVVIAVDWPESEFAHVHISCDGADDVPTACHESPVGGFDAGDFVLQQAKRDLFLEQLESWKAEGWRIAMFFNKPGEIERFEEIIPEDIRKAVAIEIYIGQLTRGFTVPSAKLAVLSDAEIFGRYQHARARRLFGRERKAKVQRRQTDWKEIEINDLVVHSEYGIAKFKGLTRRENNVGIEEDVLALEYDNHSRLFVPLEHAHLVSKYVGAGKNAPKLNKLGDAKWGKTKKAAEKAIEDYAAQLLTVQAERETAKAYSHPEDNKWQWEFENSFLYKETPDQLTSIEETKRDMEAERPMDRLICGDVGFGKTEVAIRAAFKAVMGERQVALLVPTTVLAQQHYQSFRERMSNFPINIELLSRYRTPKEQRAVVKGLIDGSVDIVIGTHRLVSKDIAFAKLGLVIIDEEQRFGVKHKERFKQMFRLIDVLTLSATPIPRTLYQSLMGVKDMSTIETPPPNRYPVHTSICPYDEPTIRDAINRELKRQGQVFYLHNRVATIEQTKQLIEDLCPTARVDFGHGQMHEDDLEDVMKRFIDGEIDVFVCTTIIESGIDIPNANTILIDRADRFGLADLYQLRGRVGRTGIRAYAILMLPPALLTTGDARKRVNAIRQYSSLGAGFKIAMRDLEIRGAGNLLGLQQSGHIVAVGFDLYCQLLKQAVARMSGSRVMARIEVALRIDFIALSEAEFLQAGKGTLAAYVSAEYIEEPRLRIVAYRNLAEATTQKELKQLIKNWRDRFGRFPDAVDTLLRCAELKIAAASAKISSVEIEDGKLKLIRNGEPVLIAGKYPRLCENGDSKEMLMEAIRMVKSF